jgi:hypothetical protein
MDANLEEILANEELKAMHLLDYQFFSEDRKKFPPNAIGLVYNYNAEVPTIVEERDIRSSSCKTKLTCAVGALN